MLVWEEEVKSNSNLAPGLATGITATVMQREAAPTVAAEQVPDGVFVEEFGQQGPQGSLPRCANGVQGQGGMCEKERLIETLPGGVSHVILNIGNREAADNTREVTVPEGHYFFMGDNRDNSRDSREPLPTGVGFVPYENIVGRADRIIFSSSFDLPLSYHVHRFVALNRSLRRGYDPNPSPGLIIRFMKR